MMKIFEFIHSHKATGNSETVTFVGDLNAQRKQSAMGKNRLFKVVH